MITKLLLLLFFHHTTSLASKGFIPMKIVDQVSNVNNQQSSKLTTQVQPSKYAGPHHLKQLVGKCFGLVQDGYKYQMCPFHNVTQQETNGGWNAYKGVLGVWRRWGVEGHVLKSLVFEKGDSCGDSHRSVQVTLECSEGGDTELVQVTGLFCL